MTNQSSTHSTHNQPAHHPTIHKKTALILMLIAFACLSVFIQLNHREPKRDFEFHGSYSHTGGNYRVTESYVLVNLPTYDPEELLEEIHSQFILMNGEPNELTFYIYDSQEDLDNDNPSIIKKYTKPSAQNHTSTGSLTAHTHNP